MFYGNNYLVIALPTLLCLVSMSVYLVFIGLRRTKLTDHG
jgi:hypothetical protein